MTVDKDVSSARWRTLVLPSALVFAAIIYAMHGTAASLVEFWWRSGSYGHGFIVLGVSVYLLYLRRQEILAVRPEINLVGLFITCGLVGVWFASRVLAVLIGEQVSLVLASLSLIMALYGMRTARIASLPILYLFCAVPVWSYLVPLLQDSTAKASTAMSRAFGVPIYLEEVYMAIPNGVFLVAEYCSGLSFLLAAMSLGGFFALLNLRLAWTRVAIVLLALGAGVVFNWIRVTAIVLIGHHASMDNGIVRDHIMFGWVLFVFVVVLVVYCGRLLEHIEDRAKTRADTVAPAAGGAARSKVSTWMMAIACALVLSLPAYASMRMVMPPQSVTGLSVPGQLGRDAGWHLDSAGRDDEWSASLFGPDSQTSAAFSNGEQTVNVQIGYFAVQRQGAEAVNERHAVYDSNTWRRISQKSSADQLPIAHGFEVNEVSLQKLSGSQTRLVWWWYWVDQEFTADPVQAKVLQIRSILSGNQSAAIVVISSAVTRSQEQTRQGMRAWLRESAAGLAARLSEPAG